MPAAYTDNNGFSHTFRGCIPLPLVVAREATTGDVGAIAANGGLLASDTTPVLSGTGSTVSQQALWAASNVDQILWDLALPEDFDGRDDVLVEFMVASGGTTDLASFSVLTSWDGGANVTDTATDPAASTTFHKVTARISAADIPDQAMNLSIALVPAAHGTDTVAIRAPRILYTERSINPN
jgi:FlaG/FlaF family flagellin (archaellin)